MAKRMEARVPGRTSKETAGVTRADVARAAGVSLTTVTHALNPPPGARVKPETRERVCRIAREMGYRPSFVGRALVSGRTYTVGLVQPAHESMFTYFYQEIVYGMVRAMEPDDYHPLILFRAREESVAKVVRQGRVDGMLILESEGPNGWIDRIVATGIPTVVVNKTVPVAPDRPMGNVVSDHAALMRAVTEELVGLGCRRLLAVHDYSRCDPNIRMHEAFLEMTGRLAAQGVAASAFRPDRDDLRRQMGGLFASGMPWDGIFVDGVGDAAVLLEEAKRAGLTAGRDFHLVTADTKDGNTTPAREEHSAHTQQPERMGEAAWSLMRALLAGEETERTVRIPYRRYDVASGQGRAETTGNEMEDA